mgnify:CR=1 FL=1
MAEFKNKITDEELESISGGRTYYEQRQFISAGLGQIEGKYCPICGAQMNAVRTKRVFWATQIEQWLDQGVLGCTECYFKNYKTTPLSDFLDTPPAE